jgi:hypothetical protein
VFCNYSGTKERDKPNVMLFFIKGKKKNTLSFQNNNLRKLLKGLISQRKKKKRNNIDKEIILKENLTLKEKEQRKRLKYKLFKQKQVKYLN